MVCRIVILPFFSLNHCDNYSLLIAEGGYLPFASNCSANCKGDLEYTCIIQVYQLYDTNFYVLGCEFSYWGGRYFHGHLVKETCKAGLT